MSARSRKPPSILLAPLWILIVFLISLFIIGFPGTLLAQDIAQIKKGVVKITAQMDGKTQVGSGIIIKLEDDHAYIVTASHVIEGDAQPNVIFFSAPHRPFRARVLGLEGGNPAGLAALLVEGRLPTDLQALNLDQATSISGGEPIMLIGFPRVESSMWTVTTGTLSGRRGSALSFSGVADEGNSGGPVLFQGKVVGIVTEVGAKFNSAAPAVLARFALEGWGVRLLEDSNQSRQSQEEKSGQASKEIIGRDGAPLVPISAGEFWMGSLDGEGDDDEHPRHLVVLDAFYMDKFEVTVSRYAEFLQSTGRQAPKYWDQVNSGRHRNLPVIGVDWNEADAYCQWAGKRLPTEAEWEKAARGADGRIYPRGNEEPTATHANHGKGFFERVYEERLAPVGSYQAGKSPYGVYDLAGNVWEWTADWYEERYYSDKNHERNPKGPGEGIFKVIRGGSWNNGPHGVRSARRTRITPGNRYVSIGFRCARDAK